MAYAQIAQQTFASPREDSDKSFRWTFEEQDGSAQNYEVPLTGNPTLKMGDSEDDPGKPIITHTLEFQLKEVAAPLIDKVRDAGLRDIRVTVEELTAGRTLFEGYVIRDYATSALYEDVQGIPVRAIGSLVDTEQAPTLSTDQQFDVFAGRLNSAIDLERPLDLYTSIDHQFREEANLFPLEMEVDEEAAAGTLGQDEDGNLREALEGMMRALGWKVFQRNGRLVWVDRYDQFINRASINKYEGDGAGGFTQQSEDLRITLDKSNVIEGGDVEQQPPVRQLLHRWNMNTRTGPFINNDTHQGINEGEEFINSLNQGLVLEGDEATVSHDGQILSAGDPENNVSGSVGHTRIVLEDLRKGGGTLHYDFENEEWDDEQNLGTYYETTGFAFTAGDGQQQQSWAINELVLPPVPDGVIANLKIILTHDLIIDQGSADDVGGNEQNSADTSFITLKNEDAQVSRIWETNSGLEVGNSITNNFFIADEGDFTLQQTFRYRDADDQLPRDTFSWTDGTRTGTLGEIVAPRMGQVVLGEGIEFVVRLRDSQFIDLLTVFEIEDNKGNTRVCEGKEIIYDIVDGFYEVRLREFFDGYSSHTDYYQQGTSELGGSSAGAAPAPTGGTSDHGNLTGLGDPSDHPWALQTDFNNADWTTPDNRYLNESDAGDLATQDTINNDDWSGTALAIANGGTGATNGSDARANLGLEIGQDVQAHDAQLDTLSGFSAGQVAHLDAIDQDLGTADPVAFAALDIDSLNFDGHTISSDTDLVLDAVGDVLINGDTIQVDKEMTTTDNLVVLNDGETGSGITAGTAGLQFDRGTETDYQILFEESSGLFSIGEVGDLQAVMTREDSPTDTGLHYWDEGNSRSTTSSDLAFDGSIFNAPATTFSGDITIGANDVFLNAVGGELYYAMNGDTSSRRIISVSDDGVGATTNLIGEFRFDGTDHLFELTTGLNIGGDVTIETSGTHLDLKVTDNNDTTFLGLDDQNDNRVGRFIARSLDGEGAAVLDIDTWDELQVGSSTVLEDTLNVGGVATFQDDLQGDGFSSGFTGSHWQMTPDGDLTAGNILLRESLRARELIYDQLGAVGGSQLISYARGKIESIDTGSNQITLEDPNNRNATTFVEDDIFWVMAWDIDGASIVSATGTVTSESGTTLTLSFDSGSISDLSAGDVIVQRGNTSDSDRQSLIYQTASDADAPFTAYYQEVDTVGSFSPSNVTTQVGVLDNLNSEYGISGNGLFGASVYLTESVLVGDLNKNSDYLEYASGSLAANLSELDITIDSNNAISADGSGVDIRAEIFELESSNAKIGDTSGWFGASDILSYSDTNGGEVGFAGFSADSEILSASFGTQGRVDIASTNTNINAGYSTAAPNGIPTVGLYHSHDSSGGTRAMATMGETLDEGWTNAVGFSFVPSKDAPAWFRVDRDVGDGTLTGLLAGANFDSGAQWAGGDGTPSGSVFHLDWAGRKMTLNDGAEFVSNDSAGNAFFQLDPNADQAILGDLTGSYIEWNSGALDMRPDSLVLDTGENGGGFTNANFFASSEDRQISVGSVFSADGSANTGLLADINFDTGKLYTGDATNGYVGMGSTSAATDPAFWAGADNEDGSGGASANNFLVRQDGKVFYDSMGTIVYSSYEEADFGELTSSNQANNLEGTNEWFVQANASENSSSTESFSPHTKFFVKRFGEDTLTVYSRIIINNSGDASFTNEIRVNVYNYATQEITDTFSYNSLVSGDPISPSVDISSLNNDRSYRVEVEIIASSTAGSGEIGTAHTGLTAETVIRTESS